MESNSRTATSDSRRVKRLAAKRSVSVICRKGTMGLGPNLAVRANNVSMDGAQLLLKSPLAVGDEIEVVFSATGISSNFSREAKVIWCGEPTAEGVVVGVRFRHSLAYEQIFYMT